MSFVPRLTYTLGMLFSRRQILAASVFPWCAARAEGFRPRITQVPELSGKLGMVTASFSPHIAESPKEGQIRLAEFPKLLRHELDLTIIDFNTMNFPSLAPAYAEKLRKEVDAAGCVATNLKMNQKVDMASVDPSERAEAMRQYREAIDAAKILGCRWVRPLPRSEKPDEGRQRAAFDELIDYAGERGITVLLENFGWAMGDPESIVRLADSIGRDRVAIGPDTGNWTTNDIRYRALEITFPRAVTCDFKAKGLGPDGEHEAYDLRRCFDIGCQAGFRGPWCFEYGHADLKTAMRGIGFLRDSVREWTGG
ncbi:MAG: TIM barrel protein [Verrucomicrobiae bacterium]|nr:TIM barrel protein [Verrucomicrobiae bacterium]